MDNSRYQKLEINPKVEIEGEGQRQEAFTGKQNDRDINWRVPKVT